MVSKFIKEEETQQENTNAITPTQISCSMSGTKCTSVCKCWGLSTLGSGIHRAPLNQPHSKCNGRAFLWALSTVLRKCRACLDTPTFLLAGCWSLSAPRGCSRALWVSCLQPQKRQSLLQQGTMCFHQLQNTPPWKSQGLEDGQHLHGWKTLKPSPYRLCAAWCCAAILPVLLLGDSVHVRQLPFVCT